VLAAKERRCKKTPTFFRHHLVVRWQAKRDTALESVKSLRVQKVPSPLRSAGALQRAAEMAALLSRAKLANARVISDSRRR